VKTPAELTDLFRARGLKVTPQRQAIFRVLHGDKAHPTAEWVYEAVSESMPTISLRTVYQTLNDLSARFDPNLDAHHHLVCDECGRVVDVYADASALRVSGPRRHGFTISSTEVVFRGTCPTCKRKGVNA